MRDIDGPTLAQARDMAAQWSTCAQTMASDWPRLSELLGVAVAEHNVGVAHAAVSARLRAAMGRDRARVIRHIATLFDAAIADLFLDGRLLGAFEQVFVSILAAPRAQSAEHDMPDWNEVFRWAALHATLTGLEADSASPRPHAIAAAIGGGTLRKFGYQVARPDGRVELSEASDRAFLSDLEHHIRIYGGLNLAKKIFGELEASYREDLDRYCVQRRGSPTHTAMPERPYAYLLALAIKHIHHPGRADERIWIGIRDLATAYTTLLDAQDYGTSLMSIRDTDTIIEHMQRMAVFDTVFRVPQMATASVVYLLENLILGAYDGTDPGSPILGCQTLQDIVVVATSVLRWLGVRRGPVTFSARDIADRAGLDVTAVENVLRSVFCRPDGAPNATYLRPLDANGVYGATPGTKGMDAGFHPLIQLDDQRFLIIDRLFAGAAFIEAVFIFLRKVDWRLDENMGHAQERCLIALFEVHGIPVASGTYTGVDGRTGECDLVIECDDTIIFLECKKKALTRAARAGKDVEVLLSLAGSLVHAQAQAGSHAAQLRRDGHLELVSTLGEMHRVDWRERKIECVAVSLFDFGVLHYRDVMKQFLEGTLGLMFNLGDTSDKDRYQPAFDDLNRHLQAITEQFHERSKATGPVAHPFMDRWFIGVPHVMYLIKGCKSANGFLQELTVTQRGTVQTLDFYFDHAYIRNLMRPASGAAASPS